ncbi:MAG TPA: rhomboid family intramembrane serine protease [Candidatus Obscuribacterales bacterium]
MALALIHLLTLGWLDSHPLVLEQLEFVPARLTAAWQEGNPLLLLSSGMSLITQMFLHYSGNLSHLLGNMLGLFALGPAVEARLGGRRFLALFLLSGIAGALTMTMISPADSAPLIGASGAIFGVATAYMVLWWRTGRVFSLVMLGPVPLPLLLSAPAAVGLKVGMELWAVMTMKNDFSGPFVAVAHWDHLGGIVTGIVVGLLYHYRILGKRLPLPEHTLIEVPDARDLFRYFRRKLTPAKGL